MWRMGRCSGDRGTRGGSPPADDGADERKADGWSRNRRDHRCSVDGRRVAAAAIAMQSSGMRSYRLRAGVFVGLALGVSCSGLGRHGQEMRVFSSPFEEHQDRRTSPSTSLQP